MILAPRYDGTAILSIAGGPSDVREPFIRQRRRMQTMLLSFSDHQWAMASRCVAWTVRDVVAHLVTVNAFWRSSILAGLAQAPTRMLVGFDPAATPPLLVDSMRSLSATEVRDQFVATTDALVDAVSGLTDDEWMALAESPAGILPVRLLVQHALWDSWIHERDIALPLGINAVSEPDELRVCLQFAAAIGPSLGIGLQRERRGTFAVDGSNPTIRFVLEVGDSVALENGPPAPGVPCLNGDTEALIEALSLRAPMPKSTPSEWTALLNGLESAFDVV